MKTTTLRQWTAVLLAVLTTMAAARVSAEQSEMAAKPTRTYTGTVTSVDPKNRVLGLKKSLFSHRSFMVGDHCGYALLDSKSGGLENLRPGARVTVNYQDVNGVRIADRIEQQAMRYEGIVKALDPALHSVTVDSGVLHKQFRIADDCEVLLHKGKPGEIADLQPGHRVAITYELPEGVATAREIARTSATFTGSLTAIDLTDRTISARSFLGLKQFHLGNDCAIVLDGNTGGRMRDLKPGDKLTFSYDEVSGINVAHRIEEAAESTQDLAAQANP